MMNSFQISGRICLLLLVGIVASSCRTSLTRTPVDFGKAEMSAAHTVIRVDGVVTCQDEWADSVTVPLTRDGQANVLWNDKGIYVLFAGDRLNANDPEAICLDVSDFIDSSNCQSARFHIQQVGGDGDLPALVKVVRNRDWQSPLLPPFDEELIKFRAHSAVSKRAMPWTAELFMSWKLLECNTAPRGTIIAHVYRLAIERPTSVLITKRSRDTQQPAGADGMPPAQP